MDIERELINKTISDVTKLININIESFIKFLRGKFYISLIVGYGDSEIEINKEVKNKSLIEFIGEYIEWEKYNA